MFEPVSLLFIIIDTIVIGVVFSRRVRLQADNITEKSPRNRQSPQHTEQDRIIRAARVLTPALRDIHYSHCQ